MYQLPTMSSERKITFNDDAFVIFVKSEDPTGSGHGAIRVTLDELEEARAWDDGHRSKKSHTAKKLPNVDAIYDYIKRMRAEAEKRRILV